MTNTPEDRVVCWVVTFAAIAVVALIGGYLGLIFGGLLSYALTVTV
jgi:hypothetical protein